MPRGSSSSSEGCRVEGTGEVEGLARFVTLHDPDGNVVQLIEYLADTS